MDCTPHFYPPYNMLKNVKKYVKKMLRKMLKNSTHLASSLSIIMPNVKMSFQHTCQTWYLLRQKRGFSSPITMMKISFFQTRYLPRHGPASFTLLHQLLPQHLPKVRSFFFSLTTKFAFYFFQFELGFFLLNKKKSILN